MLKCIVASGLCMCVLLTSFKSAECAVPPLIHIQGLVNDTAGNPIPDGNYAITVSMWDDTLSDTMLWTETQPTVSVTGGLFNALVGTISHLSDSVFSAPNVWLEIAVGADPPMPRFRLVSTPYAFRVMSVDGAHGGTLTSKLSIGTSHTNTGEAAFVAGDNNSVTGDFSVIAGGKGNYAPGDYAAIGGGKDNKAYSEGAVAGGNYNYAGPFASVGGGVSNYAPSDGAVIAGGHLNVANGYKSAIAGGAGNEAMGAFASVGGGLYNFAKGDFSHIGGGGSGFGIDSNFARGPASTISGGRANIAEDSAATVGGGANNRARGMYSVVAGGGGTDPADSNSALGPRSAIGGGGRNTATGWESMIAGGINNYASGDGSVIGGGVSNIATAYASTSAGGIANLSAATGSTVGGGSSNKARGVYSVVSGGGGVDADSNSAMGDYSTIGGGRRNVCTGLGATVAGGQTNSATANFACVPGGVYNTASGRFAFAAGRHTAATHIGSFVWGDSLTDVVSSPGINTFTVRASGGIWLGTTSTPSIDNADFLNTSTGAHLTTGGVWTNSSDENAKENFSELDRDELLQRLSVLPIRRWNYKTEGDRITHIGPVAQDFYALFGVGTDDKTISTIDPSGIALAAIQQLYERNQELEAALLKLQSRVDELEASVGADRR